MKAINSGLRRLVFVGLTLWASGCTTGALPDTSPNPVPTTGLQVTPSSTTVSTGQNMAFQASGGTPPYQFQVTGVGSIDNYGNFQSGFSTGQSLVQVTDANGLIGNGSVSVVQSTYNGYSSNTRQVENSQPTLTQSGLAWSATSSTELKKQPIVQGVVLATNDQSIDAQGDKIYSKFYETNLKHSVVRLDELIEDKKVVAVQALVEDQFLVRLGVDYSEADLSGILLSAKAHISKHLQGSRTYLVSMDSSENPPGSSPGSQEVSVDFIASRALLKTKLNAIGVVSPNYLTRMPASPLKMDPANN